MGLETLMDPYAATAYWLTFIYWPKTCVFSIIAGFGHMQTAEVSSQRLRREGVRLVGCTLEVRLCVYFLWL